MTAGGRRRTHRKAERAAWLVRIAMTNAQVASRLRQAAELLLGQGGSETSLVAHALGLNRSRAAGPGGLTLIAR